MIGNKFSGPILPLNDGDPTHISGYGKGGLYTSVDTTTDRDNIPVSKREHGMIVAVGNSGTDGTSGSFTNYQLIIPNWYALDNSAKLTALTDNNNWTNLIPIFTTPISRIITNIAIDTTAGNSLYTDYIYIATAVVELTLPTAISNSNMYTFKNGFTSNCTVVFTSGQNADGSTSIIVTPNQSLSFVSDNSNYKII